MTAHISGGDRLKRELERSAEEAGCTIDWVVERSEPWSSGSFIGGQHYLSAWVTGRSRLAWLEQLDEYSVYLPGHVLVALDVSTIEQHGLDRVLAHLEGHTVREA